MDSLNQQKYGSFHLFHFKVIDYAGLFPPTSLTLDKAINNYSNYRNADHKWMLSRFIIPGSRINELNKYMELFEKNPPFLFSVLGKATNKIKEFEINFRSVIENIISFEENFRDNIKIDALELKFPSIEVKKHTKEKFEQFLQIISTIISDTPTKNKLDIFLELTDPLIKEKILKEFLQVLVNYNKTAKIAEINFLAFKLRTGGVVPEAFPPVEVISRVILECSNYGIPWKATAGLHHPIRHYNESVKNKMHGFINVIGATALNEEHKLDIETLNKIISDENPKHFKFENDLFSWKDIEISSQTIYKSRFKRFISFGSCSFNEPKEDMIKLNLM